MLLSCVAVVAATMDWDALEEEEEEEEREIFWYCYTSLLERQDMEMTVAKKSENEK